jgi:hypothetical protein
MKNIQTLVGEEMEKEERNRPQFLKNKSEKKTKQEIKENPEIETGKETSIYLTKANF